MYTYSNLANTALNGTVLRSLQLSTFHTDTTLFPRDRQEQGLLLDHFAPGSFQALLIASSWLCMIRSGWVEEVTLLGLFSSWIFVLLCVITRALWLDNIVVVSQRVNRPDSWMSVITDQHYRSLIRSTFIRHVNHVVKSLNSSGYKKVVDIFHSYSMLHIYNKFWLVFKATVQFLYICEKSILQNNQIVILII